MTIVCALKDPKGGVWIGSDTICTNGYMKEHIGRKWVQCGKFWIGWAGKVRGMNLIEVRAAQIAQQASFSHVVDCVHGILIDDKWKPREEAGEPLAWTCEFVITDGETIVSVSGDMSFTEQPIRTAIGTGAEAALGAWYASHETGETMIRTMINAAVQVAKSCNGEPWCRHIQKQETTDVS